MKGKNILILALVAAGLVGLALVTSKDKKSAPLEEMGQLVFPDLQTEKIVALSLTSPDEKIRITKKKDTWIVESKYNYPAKFDRLKDAIVALSKLKISQTVSASEKQLKEMKLVLPGEGVQDSGSLLELFDSEGKVLASLLIGIERHKTDTSDHASGNHYPEGQFVSTDGGKTAILLSEPLIVIQKTSVEWVSAEVMNIKPEDINEIIITSSDKKEVKLVMKGEGPDADLAVEDLGENEETDSTNVSYAKSVLNYLYFDDLADPALPDVETGMDKPGIFVVKTKNNEIYTVKVGRVIQIDKDTLQYIKVSAELTEGPTPSELKDEDKAKLAEKIKTFNERLSKWTFLIRSYKGDNMTMDRSKFAKEKEKKEEAPEAEAE